MLVITTGGQSLALRRAGLAAVDTDTENFSTARYSKTAISLTIGICGSCVARVIRALFNIDAHLQSSLLFR